MCFASLRRKGATHLPTHLDYTLCWMGDFMSFLSSTEKRCDGGGLKSDNNYLSVPWVIVRKMSRSHNGEVADLHLPLHVSFERGLSQAEPK